MKTPLQEVFAHLRASKESDSFGEAYCVDWLLEMEESLLEKEKKVITDAFWEGTDVDGYMRYDVPPIHNTKKAEEYYNETFKNTEQ